MGKSLTIGLIGLDTSHVTAFAALLNDPTNPNHIAGGRIVAGFPGASDDFDLSRDRVGKFTSELRDKFGVEILDSPRAVADRVDLVCISSVDGRKHLKLFEETVGSGKPTFIDKPFTANVADAEAILALARAKNVTVMSCSSLRYADPFTAALRDDSKGAIVGIDVCGPMAIQPVLPGFFWYGCHTVEMVVAALGAGCVRVQDTMNDHFDLATLTWNDGRVATIRGMRRGHQSFGAVIHREKGTQWVEPYAGTRQPYAPMLEAILRSLPQGVSDVPAEQMLECVRVMESLNESRDNGGAAVELAPAAA